MLYNPAWRDPAPLTLPKLIAWLERQPAAQKYDYGCHGSCLLAQFVRAHGYPNSWIGATKWWPENFSEEKSLSLALNRVAQAAPYIFGAALDRAKMALAEQEGRAP